MENIKEAVDIFANALWELLTGLVKPIFDIENLGLTISVAVIIAVLTVYRFIKGKN